MRLLTLPIVCVAGLIGCNAEGSDRKASKTDAATTVRQGNIRTNLQGEGTAIIVEMLQQYYILKDGFVVEDDRAVRNACSGLMVSLTQLDTLIAISGSGFENSLMSRDSIRRAITDMLSLKDENFARRRPLFRYLSANMHTLLQEVALRNATVLLKSGTLISVPKCLNAARSLIRCNNFPLFLQFSSRAFFPLIAPVRRSLFYHPYIGPE
jgi:hypothetical protein